MFVIYVFVGYFFTSWLAQFFTNNSLKIHTVRAVLKAITISIFLFYLLWKMQQIF